jgi:putative ABC transport system permease protein
MNSFFGISMTSIALVLIVLLGISLAVVAFVAIRHRIMFFIGLRNIPRRRAQTVLIILGLMLSTLIISAAFTTGDTVDYSLTSQSYNLLGHVDEAIQHRGEGDDPPRRIDSTIPQADVDRIKEALASSPSEIDGFLPLLFQEVPVVSPRSRQSEPSLMFTGIDPTSLDGFPDIIAAHGGKQLDVASLGPNELFMDSSGADKLDVQAGDSVQVFVQNQPHDFKVVDIAKDRFLSGVGGFEAPEGMVTRLDTLQALVNKPNEVSAVAISNTGGVRDSLGPIDEVKASLSEAYARADVTDLVETYAVKRDLVDSSEEAGNFMATFFLIFGLFSVAAGMLLIVMIFVMLAAERKSELGMSRAVGMKRRHVIETFLSEGMAYNLAAAMVGAALGVFVAFAITNAMGRIFSQFHFNIQPHVTPRSLVISYSLGVVLTFLTVTFASWRASNLNIVRAIRDIPEPTGRRMGRRWFIVGILAIVIGVLLVYLGLTTDKAFPFALGSTLATGGTALVLRYIGFAERPVFSAMGLFLLVFWGFVAGNRLEFLLGKLNGDIEMFFLSGIAMVAAATFVVIYNADLLLGVLGKLGGAFGPILPAMKTAIAYPLAAKFRTGMTLAMISLVIFALTMMSTMNFNFDRLFLADSARGGWDVIVQENPNNPIPNIAAALRINGASSTADGFRSEGAIRVPGEARVGEVTSPGAPAHLHTYPVLGVDAGFVDGGQVPLSARARGYDSDEAVWQALKSGDNVAVIDHFTLGGVNFGGGDSFHVSGIDEHAKVFDPITLTIANSVGNTTANVQVIGVIQFAASASFLGVYIPEQTFTGLYGKPITSIHLVGLKTPNTARTSAREIEGTLLSSGIQADSLKKKIDDNQALTRNFFRLMQSFMGLGLFVGIAAVGVVAFRTVVERRQQIGMLRAIGYKRNMVALSFLLESSFIALLGVLTGVGLAIWLSYFLITSSDFPSGDAGYAIPWVQIVIFAALAFVASLVMTYIPSRQAASIPIADALRYE